MKRLAGIFGIMALITACDVGGTSGDDGDDDEDRITCMAELSVAGTFAIGAPQPAEIQGCWPIGTWTFAPTIVSNDCSPAPTLLPQYQFRVDRDTTSPDPDYTWTYTSLMPADPTVSLGVSSGGGGLCSGHYEIYSGDIGEILLQFTPALQADGTINGQGSYEVHTVDQRPEPPDL